MTAGGWKEGGVEQGDCWGEQGFFCGWWKCSGIRQPWWLCNHVSILKATDEFWEFPGGLVNRVQCFQWPWPRVQSLVGELRSHKLRDMVKRKEKKKRLVLFSPCMLEQRWVHFRATLRHMNYIADGNVNVITTLETGLAVLFKTKKRMDLSYEHPISCVGIYPSERKPCFHSATWTPILMAALYILAYTPATKLATAPMSLVVKLFNMLSTSVPWNATQ